MNRSCPLPVLLPRVLSILLALGAAACGGGGGGGDGGSTQTTLSDFLVTDAPADELLSFSATVESLQLVRVAGGSTANVLEAPVSIEFLGLQESSCWVARAPLPAGTFAAARMTLRAGSIRAVDKGAQEVDVDVVSSVLIAPFASPLVVDENSYQRILVDLDVSSSLSGDLSSPPLVFEPSGSASSDDGSSSDSIDEVKGIVTSKDAAAAVLTIDAYVDDDLIIPLGEVEVSVLPSTHLTDDDDFPFSGPAAFFNALQVGQTLIEVHGQLSQGRIRASRIEIEDHSGGDDSSHQVKIEGVVTALTGNTGFDLMIREIEKGASIAIPVLDTLGNPSVIAVAYDVNTSFYSDSDTPSSSDALRVGQKVKVKFPTFVNPPFYASQVEIEDRPEFEGRVVDTSELPNAIVIHVFADEPSVMSGRIASPSTDVRVDLSASTLFIDTEGKPAVDKVRLLTGLKIEVHGAISGPPAAPEISATKSKIHAGRFEGTVLAIAPGMMSFTAGLDELKDPFGDSVTTPPFRVDFVPETAFRGDVRSAGEFFDLFSELGPGEVLEIEVEGIGSGFADEILVYEIEAERED